MFFAGISQGIVVFDEQQVHYQSDHFPGREVLPGGFIRFLGKLADQFLEHHAHLGVAHHLRVQVDPREALRDQV